MVWVGALGPSHVQWSYRCCLIHTDVGLISNSGSGDGHTCGLGAQELLSAGWNTPFRTGWGNVGALDMVGGLRGPQLGRRHERWFFQPGEASE